MTTASLDATAAQKKFDAAITPTRSLIFYTLTATLPILVITSVLLFWRSMGRVPLVALATLGAITGIIGLGRLMYEMTLDIAGFPDYKLPIWAVFFLIVYLISGFAFFFFGIHIAAPGSSFGGFVAEPRGAFLDATYLSLCNYIAVSPDPSITVKTQGMRYANVIQGVVSLFINLVIITKFVNSF
jgi:hypothetical protein